ncbi:MAG: nucleotidyltransferase/DNA polymerase [Planctomycetota bacterium]|nr:nucleotidyltransferase/DNA polymerase [Planctomycetota bacterium]
MLRVLCVWFPNWSIQRLRSERPELKRSELVLFNGQSQRLLITAFGLKARRMGIRMGQTLAEAKALLPRAVFVPDDIEADRNALRQLALDSQRFSPLVGLEEGPSPESLLSDVTGCTHLWGDEEQFLHAVRDYWIGRGYDSRLALAGSLGAAWALARAINAVVVPEGDETAALSSLPVALLRLPTNTLQRLEALGLRTILDVLRLPRETLASRFGAILPQRLDQALGKCPEIFEFERLREPLSVVREWEVPVDDRLALAFLCREMIGTLLSIADHPGTGLQELEGELRTESAPVILAIRLVEPTRNGAHLAQLVELQLERQKWSGGIIAMRWTVVRLGRLPQVQHNWFGDHVETETSQHIVALIDRLSSRLGAKAVLRVESLPDAQPEHMVQLRSWTDAESAERDRFAMSPELSRGRPFRLLDIPQPIVVVSVVPDGPPICMVWQRQDYRVSRFWGPERIATGWWRTSDVQRDYYRVEWEDGSHVWIFRDRRGGGWFLHGFFE